MQIKYYAKAINTAVQTEPNYQKEKSNPRKLSYTKIQSSLACYKLHV